MQIIKASAGSGKTYRLTYEYVRNVIDEPFRYRSILAVTFTNKATNEMKRRILNELNDLSTGKNTGFRADLKKELTLPDEEITLRAQRALQLILHDYSHFSVFTIDKFFQKILRAFIKELNLESDYTVDFNRRYLLGMAVDHLIDSMNDHPRIKEWLTAFAEDHIEQNKHFNLKNDLTDFSEIIFSEKFNATELAERREALIAFFEKVKSHAAAIRSYMQGRAAEAIRIIQDNGLTLQDFHGGSRGFATYFYKISRGTFEDYKSSVANARNADSKWGKGISPEIKETLRPILNDICSAWDENKRFLLSAEASLKKYRSFILLADISDRLDEVCANNHIMLLSTTTRLLSSLIAENDAPFIYEKYGTRYDTFMIDEFQDTSSRQWKNFAPLLNNALSENEGARESVTLVGDIKQSIYRWRGGDWRLLHGKLYDDILLKNKISVQELRTNWRSLRNIIRFNNAFIRKCIAELNEEMNSSLDRLFEEGGITKEERAMLSDTLLHAYNDMEQQYSPNHQKEEGYIQIEHCSFEQQENLDSAVRIIEQLQERGIHARDIAVLVRTNNMAKEFAEYLLAYKNRHPEKAVRYCYDIVSNQALLLHNSEAVEFIIACFRLSSGNGSNDLIRALYNRYLGRPLSAPIPEKEQEELDTLRFVSLEEAFEKITAAFQLATTPENIAYIQALQDLILSFSAQNISDIPLFLEWWDKEGEKQTVNMPEGQNAITVQTIHSSKGLQYKVVIMPYLNWNMEPIPSSLLWVEKAQGPFAFADHTLVNYNQSLPATYFAYSYCNERLLNYVENMNMLYVALTRAEEELYLVLPDKTHKNEIAATIEKVFATEGSSVYIRNTPDNLYESTIEGEVTEEEGQQIFRFGTPPPVLLSQTKKDKTEDSVCDTFYSTDYKSRIRIRFDSERYSGEGTVLQELSPRNYGILMHRLFENIEQLDDMERIVDKMCYDGELPERQKPDFINALRKIAGNKTLKELFGKEWEVRNEHNILLPVNNDSDSGQFRPDRVVINGDKVRILDYKFGTHEDKRYLSQMKRYIRLMQQMGYNDVKGYIWYIQTGTIQEVSNR